MTPTQASAQTLQERNQAGLCRELDRVYAALTGTSPAAIDFDATEATRAMALDRICESFGLTPFERDLLLLCAGCELEARFSDAFATAHNDPRSIWPTLSVALAKLADPHWSAIGPEAPLRYWRLIEISAGAGLVRSPLRITERILHFLTGISCIDERLQGLVRRMEPAAHVNPALHRVCAAKVAEHLVSRDAVSRPVLLMAKRNSDHRPVAEEVFRALDLPCFTLRAADIPAMPEDRSQIGRLWTREALLTGAVLFIGCGDGDAQEAYRLRAFLDIVRGPIAVEITEGSDLERMDGLRIPVPSMTAGDRKVVWKESLGDAAACMNGSLDRIADYFDLDAHAIRLAGSIAKDAVAHDSQSDPGTLAWQECRVYARRSFEGLARRVQPRAGWNDLVLPELQKDTLRQIVAHVRQRSFVHGKWGFAERYAHGLGVTALFSGVSGTGKTMAAEVVAGELDLDLFQIDLSSVVSKYIGETEKNLRRIFDAAERSGAVLLFDEADALFGKRSEVKDSHDRYANLEISYLLQRMEAYHGLAILTTNMKQALDSAFLRRIRFILSFPFPGPEERSRIWRGVFPTQTLLGSLDFTRISQLNVAGGVIRNIAVHAAFLAADQGSGVEMQHILRAAKVEYAKLDKPLTPSETGGWQ